MNAYVVDTNVVVVASCRAPQAGPACVLACINALEQITQDGLIVLDDQYRILTEYTNNLSPSGQPGVGDAFFKWVLRNQANIERCERVTIHPRGNSGEDYVEFPSTPSLCKFDPSDRKFVAVAIGSTNDPEVLNAVDPDWWEHRVELKRCGVRVKFLCQGQFS